MSFKEVDAKSFASTRDADDPTVRLARFIAGDVEETAQMLAVYDAGGTLQGGHVRRGTGLPGPGGGLASAIVQVRGKTYCWLLVDVSLRSSRRRHL
jgi:hypothetical protein